MVWLVNMADTDRPKRNSTEATSPQQEAQGGEQSVEVSVIEQSSAAGCMVTFRTLRSLFSLTDNTFQQPWCLQLRPVHHRMTEASPPLGSASKSTSWDHFSPPNKAGGRSSRCPLLVLLLKKTMKRVSADSIRVFYVFQLYSFDLLLHVKVS